MKLFFTLYFKKGCLFNPQMHKTSISPPWHHTPLGSTTTTASWQFSKAKWEEVSKNPKRTDLGQHVTLLIWYKGFKVRENIQTSCHQWWKQKALRQSVQNIVIQPTYFFPMTGDAQCHDGEHVVETGNRNPIGTVTELCIATVLLCYM